ncbi:pyruvate formate lyase family protein [Escherichia coli]
MKIDVQLEQDSYIPARGKVLPVKTGNMKSTFVISFSKTIPRTKVMNSFWPMPPRRPPPVNQVMDGIRIENATHAPVDFDTNIATTITAHGPGHIQQGLEKIVGLQTNKPLKSALPPLVV